jgi:hypothetical protein
MRNGAAPCHDPTRALLFALMFALMLGGCTEVPDPRVEHATLAVASVFPALEHYRVGVGHYPKSLNALRGSDLQVSGSDTGAIRATTVAIERSSNTEFASSTYRSDDDTSYRFTFKAGPDSARGLGAVTCSFYRAGNAWCSWERRVSAVRTEMTFRSWGPRATAVAWWRAGVLAMISWPVIVLAGAIVWKGKRCVDALLPVAIVLNVAAGLLVFLLPDPPAELDVLTSGLMAAATFVLWFGVAFVAVLKSQHYTSRFGLAAAAVAGGVVGGFVVNTLLAVTCIGTTNCL